MDLLKELTKEVEKMAETERETATGEEYTDEVYNLASKLASKSKGILKKKGKAGNVDDILKAVGEKMGIASSMMGDCCKQAKKILAGTATEE